MAPTVPIFLRQNWSLCAALFLFWGLLAFTIFKAMSLTRGQLIYPLDDAYIHLAVAKNLAQNGSWSLNGTNFCSCSSSLLWTVLISAFYLFLGEHALLAPLGVNILLGSGFLIFAYYWLKDAYNNHITILVILVSAIFFTPLPMLAFLGMEHVLHLLIFVVFIALAADLIANNICTTYHQLLLLLMAPLVTTVRYEGLFVVFAVCVAFLWRGKVSLGILVGLLALTPLVIYGIISVRYGWSLLPNGVLLKGTHVSLASFTEFMDWAVMRMFSLYSFWKIPGVILMIVSLLVINMWVQRNETLWHERRSVFLTIYFIALLLHSSLAEYDSFYRYEAYLVAGGIIGVGANLCVLAANGMCKKPSCDSVLKCVFLILFLVIMGFPFFWRAGAGLMNAPTASKNIYEQQIQMAKFLRYYYPTKAVAVNDIGAISYFSNIKLIDLRGLASKEMAKAIISHKVDIETIQKVVDQKKGQIAVVYDKWYRKNGASILPHQWVKVAEWTISNNKVCAGDTVSFYSIGKNTEKMLHLDLKKYEKELPSGVAVKYY